MRSTVIKVIRDVGVVEEPTKGDDDDDRGAGLAIVGELDKPDRASQRGHLLRVRGVGEGLTRLEVNSGGFVRVARFCRIDVPITTARWRST